MGAPLHQHKQFAGHQIYNHIIIICNVKSSIYIYMYTHNISVGAPLHQHKQLRVVSGDSADRKYLPQHLRLHRDLLPGLGSWAAAVSAT